MLAVADILRSEPVCIRATCTLRDAVRRVQAHELRHLPVTDERGRLVGLVHDLQLFRYCDRNGHAWVIRPEHAELPVLRAAVSAGPTAEPTTRLGHVLELLTQGWEDAVVVVDGAERPVGLFTMRDALDLAPRCLLPRSRVADASSTDAAAFELRAPVREVLRRMWKEQHSHALVREGMRVVGTVALRVLVALEPRSGATLADVTVRRPIRAVVPQTPLVDAVRALAAEPGGCLPVRVEHQPRGLFTERHALAAMRRALEAAG